MKTMYRVTAAYDHDGRVIDCSQAEVLGDAYGRLYPTAGAAEAAAEIEREALADSDLDPSTRYSIDVAPLGWGRVTEDYVREMVAAVIAAPGVALDGDGIGAIVREALRADPRATDAEIVEAVLEAQVDAAVEHSRA